MTIPALSLKLLATALVVVVGCTSQCVAATMPASFAGRAKGTVDSISFEGDFRISGFYDTRDISHPVPGNLRTLDVPIGFPKIEIEGVGEGRFINPKRIFVNEAFPGLGISEYPNGSDLIDIRLPMESQDYDLRSPLGPLDAGVVAIASVRDKPTDYSHGHYWGDVSCHDRP